MTDQEHSEFVLRVLRVMSFDNCDELWWRTDEQYAPVTFFIKCSDTFAYACADLEEITPENVHELERAVADCAALGRLEEMWGPTLFVARVRKQRPIESVMRMLDNAKPLFEAVAL